MTHSSTEELVKYDLKIERFSILQEKVISFSKHSLQRNETPTSR